MTYVYVNIDIIYVYDEYKSLFKPEFKLPGERVPLLKRLPVELELEALKPEMCT